MCAIVAPASVPGISAPRARRGALSSTSVSLLSSFLAWMVDFTDIRTSELRQRTDLYMPRAAFLASQSIFHWKKELPPISPKVRCVTHGLVSETVV